MTDLEPQTAVQMLAAQLQPWYSALADPACVPEDVFRPILQNVMAGVLLRICGMLENLAWAKAISLGIF